MRIVADEMGHIRSFAKLLEAESAGCFNANGQFELGGAHGLPPAQLRVDEPTFSQPPQVCFCDDVYRSFGIFGSD